MRTINISMLLGIIILTGCASSAVNIVRDDTFQSSAITSLACMPFVKGRRCTEPPAGDNALLDCRLSAINYPIEFYSSGASQQISRILHEEVQKKIGSAVDDYDRGLLVFKRLARENPHNTLRSLASAFARERGVDHIVIGILESYIEREGSAAGIERPASVSFSLYVLHVPTGSVVFEGSFDETQQPLSENVLNALVFFKRGARWLTAGELAREGIIEILDEMQ